MQFQLTASIVTYNNEIEVLSKTIFSFLNSNLSIKLYLIDNSPCDTLRCLARDERIEYIFNPSNPGFGAAHNIAIKKAIFEAPYHLILNPDIYFDRGVNESIISYLDNNINVGVLMPLILNTDTTIQYLAKLLPTPIDFFIRRILPFKFIKEKIDYQFELRKFGYNKIIDSPFLSGCYLVVRTKMLANVGLFDENIFMYCEDIDFCRRFIRAGYRAIFYPKVFVFHDHERKSFKSFNNLKVYLKSTIYYFNKWGWFFDKERSAINKNTLGQIL